MKIDRSICRARLTSGLSCRNCIFDEKCNKRPREHIKKEEIKPDQTEENTESEKPKKRHRAWTQGELIVALNRNIPVKQAAEMLKRPPRSIYKIRQEARERENLYFGTDNRNNGLQGAI